MNWWQLSLPTNGLARLGPDCFRLIKRQADHYSDTTRHPSNIVGYGSICQRLVSGNWSGKGAEAERERAAACDNVGNAMGGRRQGLGWTIMRSRRRRSIR